MARANREGSEPRQRKDGLWQSNYTVYVEGVPKLRSVYGHNKSECRRKLRQAIADRDGGIVFDTKNLTVAEYLDRWLEWFQVRAKSVRTSTLGEIRCPTNLEKVQIEAKVVSAYFRRFKEDSPPVVLISSQFI